MKDRQTEFVDNDNIVCQEDCQFSQYDYETFKAKCSCDAKETPSSLADMNINKAKLLDNFKDIKNIVNFEFLVCYKNLFKKDGIVNNIGCYLLLIIIAFHIISIFIFYNNQFPSLKKRIRAISFGISEYQSGKVNKIGIKKENKIGVKKEYKNEKNKELRKNLFLGKGIFIFKKGKTENNIKKKNAITSLHIILGKNKLIKNSI